MSRYVDAVLIPVPTDELEAYSQIAREAGRIYVEHGALEYFEGVEDDHEAGGDGDGDGDGGSMHTFTEVAEGAPDESIVFGFIVFESREHRDEVQAAVNEDPAYQALFADGMPFDPGRMTTGSFRSIISDGN